MKSDKLIVAFDKIGTEPTLPKYLREICIMVRDETASREKVNIILANNFVDPSLAKIGFLHLIFAYIQIALEDNVLTDNEKQDIKLLKLLFKIQPGDFYRHNGPDVINTITLHLSNIYKDHMVSEAEALLKVDIQEIFDLSYDEMNEYSKIEAATAIQKGASVNHLDIVFTFNQYFKLTGKR